MQRHRIKEQFDKSVNEIFANAEHRMFFAHHPAKELLIDKLSQQILGAKLAGYLLDDYACNKIIYDLTRAWCRIMINDQERADKYQTTKWEDKNEV